MLVAFIQAKDPREEFLFFRKDAYAQAFAEHIVPMIEARYRTLGTAESRASVGAGAAGYAALYAAFKHPGVIGRAASQSTFLLTMQAMSLFQLIDSAPSSDEAEQPPMAVFLEWGNYDRRSEHEAWDIRTENKNLGEVLKSRGFEVTTSEVLDGSGWASWRNRNDEVLEWLFPIAP